MTARKDWRTSLGWFMFPTSFPRLSSRCVMTGKRLSYCVSIIGVGIIQILTPSSIFYFFYHQSPPRRSYGMSNHNTAYLCIETRNKDTYTYMLRGNQKNGHILIKLRHLWSFFCILGRWQILHLSNMLNVSSVRQGHLSNSRTFCVQTKDANIPTRINITYCA